MATIRFSVPEPLWKEFQEVFAGENQDALITRLMERAIEDRRLLKRREESVRGILELRKKAPPVSCAEIDKARRIGRP